MAARYRVYNAAMPTTAVLAGVTSGTSTKTLLQLKPFNTGHVIAWGISFDGSGGVSAPNIEAELVDTGTVFGTVTAYADADIMKLDGSDQAVASVAGLTLGTSASGLTCTSEGSITATRVHDASFIFPSDRYVYQFPLGEQPQMIVGNALRIRVKSPTAAQLALCWIEFEI